jgi:hypothetical protein
MLEDVFYQGSGEAKDPTHSMEYGSLTHAPIFSKANLDSCHLRFRGQTHVTRRIAKKKEHEVLKSRPGIRPWATFKFLYRTKGM